MSINPQAKHLFVLDGLRAVAAMYVVAHHSAVHYFLGPTAGVGYQRMFLSIFDYGHYAVNLFIVLSGFSLMMSVTKNNYRMKGGAIGFMKRRAIRILPPYYIAISFSAALIYLFIGHPTGTHWDISIPITPMDIVKHLLLIHDFLLPGISKINHVFWSVAVEFRIYAFFPLLVAIYSRKGLYYMLLSSLIIAVLGFIALFVGFHYYSTDVALISSGVTPYIILFSFGMIAADFAFSKDKKKELFPLKHNLSQRKLRLAFIAGVSVLFLTCLYLVKGGHIEQYVYIYVKDVISGLLFAYLLYVFAILDPKWIRIVKALSWKPLVFIGSFSYSLYLIHAPLIQMLTQYVLEPMQLSRFTITLILLFVGLPIIIAISYLFFLLFERPFLTKMKAATQSDRPGMVATVQNKV
jgi:peptidoglycan/LPS O-acetylase OafA/YrhL